MYGVAGERRLPEFEIDWLPGYEGSAPVRVGQRRLRADAARRLRRGDRRLLHGPRCTGSRRSDHAWQLDRDTSSSSSRRPGSSPTTGSGRCAGRTGTSPTRRSWRGWRSTAPCARPRRGTARARSTAGARSATRSTPTCVPSGYDPELGAFVQSYGSKRLDASVLLIPLVGLPAAGRPAGDRHGRGDRPHARLATG